MRTSQIATQLESQFDLKIRSVDAVKEKSDRRVYKLHGESRNFFLKLATGSISRDRVAEEASLVEYLNRSGFNAPTLVATPSGASIFECTVDGAPACGYLTEEIQIEEPGIDTTNETHLRMAADKLARFHTTTGVLGDDFTGVNWNHRWVIDRNLQIIEPLFVKQRSHFETISRSFDRVKAHISEAWKKTDGAWGIIHGDWHATNVVIGTDGDLWFLDLESFGNGWRITDVMYLLGSPLETGGPLDLRSLQERYELFMDEYSKLGPTIGDVSELPAFWLAVRLLLHFGRQVEEIGLDASRRAFRLDAFAEQVNLLTDRC